MANLTHSRNDIRTRRVSDVGVNDLYTIKFRSILKELRAQHFSFWLLCLYFFFEYVRPQALYRSIDVLPWTQFSIAAVLVGLLFDQSRRIVTTPINWLLIVFFIVLVTSSLFGYSLSNSWANRNTMLTWFVVYIATISLVNSEKRLVLFFLAYMLFNLKMSQHGAVNWAQRGFSFAGHGLIGSPGWFRNSGEFAIQMVIFGSLAISYVLPLRNKWPRIKRYVMYAITATAYMAVMGASSRGAQLALLGIGIWAVLKVRGGFKVLLFIAVIGAALYFVLPEKQLDRFRDMGSDNSSLQRLAYWEHAIDEVIPDNPILGVGYANWTPYVSFHVPNGMGPYQRVQEPHNIFIKAAAELGYVGLLVFILLIIFAFRQNRITRSLAETINKPILKSLSYGLDAGLVGYLIAGSFVTVLYYPFFWIQLTLIVTLYSVTRDLANSASRMRTRDDL